MTPEQIEAVRAAAIEAVQSAANLGPIDARLVPVIEGLVRTAGDLGKVANALTTRLSEVERERDEARALNTGFAMTLDEDRQDHEEEEQHLRARITELEAEVARLTDKVETTRRDRDKAQTDWLQARADLATLRAAIAEAVRRYHAYQPLGAVVEPLRNLTKPDTPSERIMSDKDRENPVEGAHPTQPEGEDALVELQDCPPGLFCFNGTLGFKSEYTTTLENPRRYQCDAYVVESGEYFHGGAKSTADRAKLMVRPIEIDQLALASRGLVRGGVERG